MYRWMDAIDGWMPLCLCACRYVVVCTVNMSRAGLHCATVIIEICLLDTSIVCHIKDLCRHVRCQQSNHVGDNIGVYLTCPLSGHLKATPKTLCIMTDVGLL